MVFKRHVVLNKHKLDYEKLWTTNLVQQETSGSPFENQNGIY